MTRRPLHLLLLALLACSLALVACGGDGGDDDAETILAETFGEGKEVRSGRLDLGVRLNAQGLRNVNGPVGLRLSGPFQSSGDNTLPRFDFNLAIDGGGQRIEAGAVSTGEKGFLRFQDQAYAVGDELFRQFRDGYAEQAKCAAERDEGRSGATFQALGIDPRRWLREPRKEGEGEVGGAETTHIASNIDVPRFLEDINRVLGRTDLQQDDPCREGGEQRQEGEGRDGRPAQPAAGRQLSEQDRRQIAEAIQDARVDVWTGKDDRTMRRLNVTLRFEVPEGARQRANGLERGELRFDMTLGDLNEDQEIAEPQGAQPLDELVQRFGGQVPGLGGGQGEGASGGRQGGEQPSSQYAQCVEQAGSDVAKLQECAELIGQ